LHPVENGLSLARCGFISSLLSMPANTLDDPTTIDKLQDSERRVMSMAMIHEQLSQHNDMSSIDLAEYVRDLQPLRLILNELITNAPPLLRGRYREYDRF
jgi:two-component sensor histidine kinase